MSSRKTEKSQRHLPPVCKGPWKVVIVIESLLAVWKCDTCGDDRMVIIDQAPKGP